MNAAKLVGLGMIILIILIVGATIYLFNRPTMAPVAAHTGSPTPSPSTATPNPIATAIGDVAAGKATLIDVRTPEEYAAGHAKNAINFDSVNAEAGRLPDLPKDSKIYLYCRTGHRAGVVLSILKQAGFTNATSLGGFQAWIDAGGPQA